MKTLTHSLATMAAALALALPVQANTALVAVDYTLLAGTLATFEELSLNDPAGTLLEGVVLSGGIRFGERFAGQELALTLAPRPGAVAQDWFDNLAFGSPAPGLLLLAGEVGANLGVYGYADIDGQALAGIGPPNIDGSDPFGFGAISARFDTPVSALGLQVREADGGAGWLALYRADGSLIQTLTLGPLNNGYLAFARSDGQADIAGFSLFHTDSYYGIAIDNLVIGSVVPEPATAWLLGAGVLLGVAWRKGLGRRPAAA